ncbi:MarR family winged helix-turn-helix transcriptional regulator [Aestuariibius sp. HNIBRBA575]|uniref:MarR family winged helix-turn-helix transcriptional regulator n=1 Tax=Aestuariibius sp. HNIBRBA575 TaxID=3233343 RepID=UPI0034A4D044
MQLETYFPYLLAVTAESFSQKLVDVYGRTYGLSREEWRLLFLLAEARELTSLELSRRTTLDKVQVSRAAQRLENKDLITRCISGQDRRLRLYTCTDAGQALFAKVFPEVQAQSQDILDAIEPDDMVALKQGLHALLVAVKAHTGRERAD